MSDMEILEALEELQEEAEAIKQLTSELEVEPPDDCDRCDAALTEHYARLGFTPIGHEVGLMNFHVCEDCTDDITALFEDWYPYDRQYIGGVAFGNEPWKGTPCSSCHTEISQKPTIVAFERVKPGGYETVFAGDFLSCEHCRKQLVQDLTQRGEENGREGRR